MKILAFGASTSSTSINQRFAKWAANVIADSQDEVQILKLRDYELPVYSMDLEKASGIPQDVITFDQELSSADVIVISLAEHNGSYTAAFKNIFDWTSRHRTQMLEDKPVILLATSPGGRGGQGVLDAATDRFPRHGARLIGSFSLPRFADNFDDERGILDGDLRNQWEAMISEARAEL